MTAATFDEAMREALLFAAQSRFQTAPNPCVGAVLVRDGIIIARGRHECCGGPHAEVNALADAAAKGIDPAECDLVVTLEPCTHHGKTPPCVEAILAAKIRRVIIGALDPTPEAAGGAAFLRDHGVEVITGVRCEECTDLLSDFTTWQTTELPYTILKLAATLDGRIATRTGHSRWISCPDTRRLVHEMRTKVGAVLIGGNTFYEDNPHLTARPAPEDPQPEKQPLAVVVTSRLPDPGMAFHLLQERPRETLFWTTIAAAASRKAVALREIGVRVIGLEPALRTDTPSHHGVRAELDLRQGLADLRQKHGCLHVMCEGGGRLGISLLERSLAGELQLHLAPRILADNDAAPLFTGLRPMHIDESVNLRFISSRFCGKDLILSLRPGYFPEQTCPAEGA